MIALRELSRKLHRDDRGQTMVEFALVIPLFLLLLLAIIEFTFVFNAILGISFASRDGALTAAEAGDNDDADCAILRTVSAALTPPVNQSRISTVVIFRANADGTIMPKPSGGDYTDTYTPGGTTTCTGSDGNPYSVAFTLSGAAGYAPGSRCNVLNGCLGDQPTVDTIGVKITYVHTWVTPLRGLGGPGGLSVTVTQSNSMRMEPVL